MFRTICSNCGKDCEVPFKPTGDKPVYCRECFQNMGGNERNDRGPRRDNFDRKPNFNRNENRRSETPNNEQFQALNSKLDRIIELLTPKPVPVKDAVEVEAPVVEKSVKKRVKKVVETPEVTPQE